MDKKKKPAPQSGAKKANTQKPVGTKSSGKIAKTHTTKPTGKKTNLTTSENTNKKTKGNKKGKIILAVVASVITLGGLTLGGYFLWQSNITYTVAFTNATGVTFEGYESLEVKNGKNFTFQISLSDDVQAYDELFLVKANEKAITETDGNYVVSNVKENITICVVGVGSKNLNIQNGVLLGATQDQVNLIVPPGVTEIANNAFSNKNTIVSVIMPNTVTKLGNAAFSGCGNLEQITIGDNVKEFGFSVFVSTKWYQNQLDGLVYLNNWVYEFKNTSNLTTLNIKEGVVGIAPAAFVPLTNLQQANLPSTMLYIEENVFSGTPIKLINFPENLKKIGEYAFAGTRLETIVFPSKVEEVEGYAFVQNTYLKEVDFHSNLKLGATVFGGCSKLERVTFHQGVQQIQTYAFAECTSLKTIIILGNVMPVLANSNAFYNLPTDFKIYVPQESVNAYLTASGWSIFSNYIKSIDELNAQI